jgi:uroporphyrinogen-III synthase
MASETASRAASLGFTPVIAPMLEIRPVQASLPPPETIQAVLVTSAVAIDMIPASYHAKPLLAVGDATADAAKRAGFTTVHSGSADAQALAAVAVKLFLPDKGPLLLAAREGLGEPLELDLNDRGFRVLRHAVYAIAAPSVLPAIAATALQGDDLDKAMFFSADTARAFVRLVEAAGLSDRVARIDAVAIGKPAAVALERLPWRSVRIAAHPTQDEMLALLQ